MDQDRECSWIGFGGAEPGKANSKLQRSQLKLPCLLL